ncbi:hypothetical protein FQN57_000432 [Myotisia sp. PD_48]|nr:hypothetical protein FQN57_000432 [Myotisia sp. PD_48]
MTFKKSASINLAAKDIEAATRFALALGFEKSPEQYHAKSVSLTFGDPAFSLTYHSTEQYSTWLIPGKKTADVTAVTEVLVTLSMESKEEVVRVVNRGVEAGGRRGLT